MYPFINSGLASHSKLSFFNSDDVDGIFNYNCVIEVLLDVDNVYVITTRSGD